jgi:hypothetical protein
VSVYRGPETQVLKVKCSNTRGPETQVLRAKCSNTRHGRIVSDRHGYPLVKRNEKCMRKEQPLTTMCQHDSLCES